MSHNFCIFQSRNVFTENTFNWDCEFALFFFTSLFLLESITTEKPPVKKLSSLFPTSAHMNSLPNAYSLTTVEEAVLHTKCLLLQRADSTLRFINSALHSQPCSNDHLYKTTIRLTRPATTFFVSQMKKTFLKQPLQNFNYPAKKWEKT